MGMSVLCLWEACGVFIGCCMWYLFVVRYRDIFGMFMECLWRIMLVVCLRGVCRIKLTSVLT